MLFKYIIQILLIVTAVPTSYADSAANANSINLTESEKQWLQTQSEIHFSMTNHQEPVAFKTQNDEIKGIFPDYIHIIEKIINKKIRISLVSDNPIIVHKRAKELGLHGILAVFQTPVTEKLFLFSNPYINTPLYVFTTKAKRQSIKNSSDLQHKKIAILQGHQIMSEYISHIKDITTIIATSPKQQMEMLQYGEVDAILGYMTYHHLIRKYLFDNIVPSYSTDTHLPVQMGILPEYPPLHSIINKAISAIPASTMQAIIEKWLDKSTIDETDGLSHKERQWLKENHVVRARVSYWPPYMFPSPKPSGMSVDYLKYVAERYNINISFIPSQLSWSEALKDLKTDKKYYDLILTMHPTPERQDDYALTEPYLRMPWVIFMDKDSNFVSSIDDLKGKSVAVERGFVMHNKLKNEHPQIVLNVVDNSLAALKAVSTGKSVAYIGNLANSSYLIQEHGLGNLKVAAPTPFKNHTQSMAIRKDWPELASITSKAISLMTQQEHDKIKNKWLSVRYEHGIHYWDVLLWVLSVVSIAAIIIFIIAKVNNKLNREINQRIKVEKQLEEYLHVVDENVIISTADKNGIITKASDAFCRVSQYSREELIGNNHALIRHPDMPESLFKDLWEIISNKKIWMGEIKNLSKHGEVFWVYATISPIIDSNQTLTGYTSIYQDISDKKRVEQLSITDKLTGLFNRFKLDEVLAQEVLRSERYSNKLSLVIIDIDFFKSVNDTYGHQVGDKVLVTFAQLLKKNIRSTDIIGRWGGEEFLVICPQTDNNGVLTLFENIRKKIEDYNFESVGNKTASFGVTSFTSGDTPESLISRADTALYQAKNSGRNCVKSA